MFRQFIDFLKEYKIISLALAFIMGAASTSLIKSLVNDIIMPFILPIISSDSLMNAVLILGPIHIKYGAFLAELVNFALLALVVFIIAKKILKEEKVEKK